MGAILYMYRCKAKNWLKQSLHNPGRLIVIILMCAMLVVAFLSPASGSSQDSPAGGGIFSAQLPFFMVFIMWGLAALLSVTSLYAGTKRGSLMFTQADVQFLFTGTFLPQSLLLYGMMNMMGSTLISTFFFVYQIPTLRNLGYTPGALILTFAAYLFGLIIVSLVQQAIFLIGFAHEELRRPLRMVIAAVCIIAAVLIVLHFARGASAGSLARVMESSKVIFAVPLVGWWSRLLLVGSLGVNMDFFICLLLMLALGIVSLIYSYNTDADFYEEAAEQAEIYDAARRKAKSGKAFSASDSGQSGGRKRYKVREKGLRGGSGESSFFFLHLREMRRKNPYFLSLSMALYLAASLLLIYLTKWQNLNGETALFSFIWTGIVLAYLFGQNTPLLADLDQAIFYYSPGSSFKKILWVTLEPLLKSLIDILPGWLLLVFLTDAAVSLKLLALPLILSYSLMTLALQLIVSRLLGTLEGTLASLVYMLFLYLLALPGVGLSIAAKLTASESVYRIPVLLAAAILFNVLIYFLSSFLGVRVLRDGMEK